MSGSARKPRLNHEAASAFSVEPKALFKKLRTRSRAHPANPTPHVELPGEGSLETRARLADRFVRSESDQRRLQRSAQGYAQAEVTDWFFDAGALRPANEVFGKLRWGGQVVLSARTQSGLRQALEAYRSKEEWLVEQEPVTMPGGSRFGLGQTHAAVCRKVLLEPSESPTFKHSYDVRLIPAPSEPEGYCVLKRIPDRAQVLQRLRQNLPPRIADDPDRLNQAVDKLISRVLPVFITREAGFLKIVQRDMPELYRERVPALLSMERDAKGFVTQITQRWLRLGGEPMKPLRFAQRAANLVDALHQSAGMMHLDLRMDNFVITDNGVGLVDFGSAIRVKEDVFKSRVLTRLFGQMLSASQIRRDLRRMRRKGMVTSPVFARCYRPPTPAADLFSLVNNLCRAADHPDFRGLIEQEVESEDAYRLARVRRQALRPSDEMTPSICSVYDLRAALTPRKKPRAGMGAATGAASEPVG